MTAPLLATKLFLPPARPGLMARPRLSARLDEGGQRPLTLISAPPGFGKTTLVSGWITQSGQRAAWLSLEASDDDPARFWAYAVAALQRLQPDLGEAALSLLQSPQPPPPVIFLTTLINEVTTFPGALVLVLDDYHVISAPAIHEALAFLLDHLPPQMHVILLTRADPPLPLARLRARGQLAEVRADDLRFTPDEAAALLNQVMGLGLAAADLAALEARTEGWIVGLQLAALSMQGRADVSGFVQAFSGSHRHVLSYLVEEVLNRQPAETLEFLLRTSILERLCGPLCDFVAAEPTSASDAPAEPLGGRAMLARLEATNLFVAPLDDESQWYRYHTLFADALRAWLKQTRPSLLPELHRRASVWHEQQGFLADAVHHASAAGDATRAASLMTRAAPDLLQKGELTTLRGWIQSLPDEVVRADGELATFAGWIALLAGQVEEAGTYIQSAQAILPPEASALNRGRLFSLAAQWAVARQDLAGGLRHAQEALQRLDESQAFFRSLSLCALALGQQAAGDMAGAIRSLREAADLGQRSGQHFVTTAMLVNLAMQLYWQGRRREALALCQSAHAQSLDKQGRPLPMAGMALVALGLFAYEADDLAQARADVDEGLKLAAQLGLAGLTQSGRQVLALIQWAAGEHDAALATVRAARQTAEETSFAGYASFFAAMEAELELKRGDVAAAGRWARAANLPTADPLDAGLEAEYCAYARVLLAQNRLAEAQDLLARLAAMLAATGRGRWLMTALLLEARAHLALGQTGQAVESVGRAVSLAAPDDYRRTILDEGGAILRLLPQARPVAPEFVDGLLAALGQPAGRPKPVTQNLIEPISERELEVLRLMADGLANPEIAERLVISTGTVKTHVNNLFRKLEARSRTQAVARARTLGLLAD